MKRDVRIRISESQVQKLKRCQESVKSGAQNLRDLADQKCPGFRGQPRLHVSWLRSELRKRATWWDGIHELEEVLQELMADFENRKKEIKRGKKT